MKKAKLNQIEDSIIKILTSEVKDIIDSTRANMVVVEEKSDGDSVTIADVQIGEIFDVVLPKLLPNSLVIQEESFNAEVYHHFLECKYVWVVDPIDGTKAFRDINNSEWCVGICLLENLNPILSLVYIPEPWLGESYLLSASKNREKLFNFGKPYFETLSSSPKYVSHIHRDTERNTTESIIASIFKNNETIRAYAGHSTLAQFAEVAVNTKNKIFSRRGANIWDIIQSAYLIQKNGGEVYYENGQNIFPLNPELLEFKDNHLIMPFTIASSNENKKLILKTLNYSQNRQPN